MLKPLLGALLAAALVPAPSLAQQVNGDPATQPATTPPPGPDEVQRGYANPAMPNQDAVNAETQGGTASLNAGVTSNLQDQQAINAANEAIYQANAANDQARYDQTLQEHDRAVRRSDAHYRHQQRAYADAMSAWRLQVRDCLAGHKMACNMPPPDPAAAN